MQNHESGLERQKNRFVGKFFPARPRNFWLKASTLALAQLNRSPRIGLPVASNPVYVSWLKKESMLSDANRLAVNYSGQGKMWQNPYAKPRPRTAIKLASVWFTAYPISTITKPGVSIIGTLGQEELWDTFHNIGIRAIHTGPMKEAGGIYGWDITPSVDGHFDRITTKIDKMLGTETEFQRMCYVAGQHAGIIIDDVVPGHTGKGADFQLATMNYRDYPGIYHMVEIQKHDWDILPKVPYDKDSINLNATTEEELKKRGYIIGKLQRVIFYEPGIKETNWSVTKEVKGIDGSTRRWVYLHYFKEGQPSLNWLDPTFAAMKLVVGDALHSIGHLGSKAVRLDANGFLGIEKSDHNKPAWSEGHPLSEAANQIVSGMVRKVGGFTFQELNLSVDDIKNLSNNGADLSYDFVTRPAYHHALATADTEFLRLMMNISHQLNVDPVTLVHAMQNHDELTLELVHFWTVHKDDEYVYHDQTVTGLKLREIICREVTDVALGAHAPYNLPFSQTGIACTYVTFIMSALGFDDPTTLTAEQVIKIKQAHLLFAMFNALQPGVFAISGWDLSGSLTIQASEVAELLEDGDTRWINRGAYDLMNNNPSAEHSLSGMPKARNLYGSLPEQMQDSTSFTRQLKGILHIREKYGIATAYQIDVPKPAHKEILILVHRLELNDTLQITVLNFSNTAVSTVITSEHLQPAATVINAFNNQHVAEVSNDHSFSISLKPYEGAALLIK